MCQEITDRFDAAKLKLARAVCAEAARILVTSVGLVQPEGYMVREKQGPVLAFARVGGIEQAISAAGSVLSENLAPRHLLQFAWLAYGKDASGVVADFG
jgi:hypothetical protein